MDKKSQSGKESRRKAVALRYKALEDAAPKVLAKGRGSLAERILALAEEYGIPVKEDRDLVTLLEKLDVGREIPPDLYQVVAELLAFVYRTGNNHRK
ncbi:EscU/YscU/HrcU family type III secretion system export apparatus switch protein [Desulfobotulus sp. H1]|uniref:EscU/YscU/HrcU family type III secretion system export apparatus switch protein n=1 Tax=Desulfobotulus pelophilus TaxID=2823377 RepID=A0ABT3N5R2_9BACT|nr:EscU/YscU/HrcU family type III secretion system export apparatus switch protein [Desulfobotulus pelophilus]MCW7752372.1 EscU/YscU/HrcU family type III secretion system export apparatus switch protein [Desulfobotulus pelophilus]